MAKLIESLALSGSRKTDGAANASGKVWAFVMGTSTGATLYQDRLGTVAFSQPVTLDAAGKATIYVDQPVTLRVETSAGTSLGSINFQDAATLVAVQNAAFTGTLASGSQGAGGETDLDAVLTSALVSFGGTDFKLRRAGGTTLRNVVDFLSEIWVSVKDFGAFGDATHDDFAAIQAATNYVVSIGGGSVYFPPGNYHISAPIVNASAVGVSFRGAGGTTTITNTATTTGVFSITGGTSGGFEISHLYINHTSSSSNVAISILASFDISIHDVEIRNHNFGVDAPSNTEKLDLHRVYIDASSTAGSRAVRVTASTTLMTIRDCRLYGDTAIELKAGNYQGVNIAGNFIRGYTTGILLASVATGSTYQVSIVGNSMNATKKLSVTGTVPTLYQYGNGIDGASTTSAINVVITPDWTDGEECVAIITGGAITCQILAPTPVPIQRGVRMRIRMYNNNAGGGTWDLGTYLLNTTIANTAGLTTELEVVYDLARTKWVEIARVTHNP
jgi:hypothetical protein